MTNSKAIARARARARNRISDESESLDRNIISILSRHCLSGSFVCVLSALILPDSSRNVSLIVSMFSRNTLRHVYVRTFRRAAGHCRAVLIPKHIPRSFLNISGFVCYISSLALNSPTIFQVCSSVAVRCRHARAAGLIFFEHNGIYRGGWRLIISRRMSVSIRSETWARYFAYRLF